MRNRAALVLLFCLSLLTACSENSSGPSATSPGRYPVSIRGWISDIDTGQPSVYQVTTLRNARLIELLQQTNVSIEKAPYASGGIGETGAFVVLDAPSGRAEMLFQAPGIDGAKLVLSNIPPNADVLLPRLVISPSGVVVTKPESLRVRVPGSSANAPRRMLPQKAMIGPHSVDIWEVPLRELEDRRDYPTAASENNAPLAIVK